MFSICFSPRAIRSYLGSIAIAISISACGDVPMSGVSQTDTSESDPLFGMPAKYQYIGATRVCWENALPSDTTMFYVRDQVERTWEQVSNVHFYGWDVCEPTGSTTYGIHIMIDDSNPRTVGFGKDIMTSRPGMYLDNTFAVWSPSCSSMSEYCQRAIAAHEFGHALGYRHEQDRPETNTTMAYANACNTAGYPNPTPYNGNDATEYYTWDLNSIMNYCNPTWNNGGKLSTSDASADASIYGAYTNKIREQMTTGAPQLTQSNPVFAADLDGDGKDDLIYLQLTGTSSGNIEIWDYWSGSTNYGTLGWHSVLPNEPQNSDLSSNAYGFDDWNGDGKADFLHYYQGNPNVSVTIRSNNANSFRDYSTVATSMPSVSGSTIVVGAMMPLTYYYNFPVACQIRSSSGYYAARCFAQDISFGNWTEYGQLPIATTTPCNWFLQGTSLVCMTNGTSSGRTEAWTMPLISLGGIRNGPTPKLVSTIPLPVGFTSYPQYRFVPTTRGRSVTPLLPGVYFHIGMAKTSSTSSGKLEYTVIDGSQIF